jgi:hypothetical protein
MYRSSERTNILRVRIVWAIKASRSGPLWLGGYLGPYSPRAGGGAADHSH